MEKKLSQCKKSRVFFQCWKYFFSKKYFWKKLYITLKGASCIFKPTLSESSHLQPFLLASRMKGANKGFHFRGEVSTSHYPWFPWQLQTLNTSSDLVAGVSVSWANAKLTLAAKLSCKGMWSIKNMSQSCRVMSHQLPLMITIKS